jgi:Asp-tRNA(Asn)/Glu-tRNA(Gln) amidotransferase A subunit family amidase
MSAYNLQSITLPRLQGRSLKLFAAALETPLVGQALCARLVRDGGINQLHTTILTEPPTGHPLVVATIDGVTNGRQPDLTAAFQPPHATGQIPLHTMQDYAAAYCSGQITPEEVASKAITAIAESDRGDKPLRAIIASDADDLLAQARAASRRFQAGQPLSPLDGVPVAIKDEVDQVPYPTTVGTRFLGRTPAVEDATVVARLRAAGALLIGKANMNEIGINPSGFNQHHGTARNPYDLARDTGGSSGGSAAAVAAGLCPVAVGADGGGSIRVPAALCGLVGLKPTYGRISEHGAAPLCWSVAHLGPIGASVADVALAYGLMAGPDPRDPMSLHQPPVSLPDWAEAKDLRGLRLGIFADWFQHADAEIVAICEQLVTSLTAAGAEVREIEIPDLELMRVAHAVTILSEMAASMSNLQASWPDFAPPTRINLALGRYFPSGTYVQAQRVRTRAMTSFREVLAQVDVIVTPATAVTAPIIPPGSLADGLSDLSTVTELMRYVFPSNLTGNPAIVFPAGYNRQGLPVAMQAIGRHWEETLLLRVAAVAEKVVDRRRPLLYYDLLAA